jgi:hypothetical protein
MRALIGWIPAAAAIGFGAIEDRGPLVTALVDGLVSYERSVEVARWKQEVYLPPSSALRRPAWLLSERSSRWTDERWRWYLDISMLSTSPPDYVPSYERTVRFGDGAVRFAARPEGGWQGVSNEVDGVFVGGSSPLTMRGRWFDYGPVNRSRTLGELVAGAADLEYISPTLDRPYPGLRAPKVVGDGFTDIVVWVDPVRGFMPVRCQTIRHHDQATCEAVEVLRSAEFQGVHFPTIGVRTCFNFELVAAGTAPVLEATAADFAAAERLEGLPIADEAVRASLLATLREAHGVRRLASLPEGDLLSGPLAWRSPDLGVITPLVLVVRDVEFSVRRSWDDLFREAPPTASYLDRYTYERHGRDECVAMFKVWTSAPDEGDE